MKVQKIFSIAILGFVLSLNLNSGAFAENDKKEITKLNESVKEVKPIIAVIKAEWCSACEKISPTVMAVMKEYDKSTQFVILDVTNSKTTRKAEKDAKKFGILAFFNENKSRTSTVAIIDPESKVVLKSFQGEGNKEVYELALNDIIKK